MMDRDQARSNLEDAVLHALEAGMTEDEVKAEVEYVIETADA